VGATCGHRSHNLLAVGAIAIAVEQIKFDYVIFCSDGSMRIWHCERVSVMKLTSLRQTSCSLDRTDACSVALIADESQYMRNGFVVLHRNGFQKRPTNGFRIPQLPSGSKRHSVISQEHCKSHQGDDDCSQVKNLVPLSCEMVTESGKALVRSDACDNTVVIYSDSRLHQDKCRQRLGSPSVPRRCSCDKSRLSVNRNQQCTSKSAVSLQSSSTSASVVCSGSVQCKWNKCGCEIASDMLLEHIRIKHVATQSQFSDDNEVSAEEQSFVCLWNGCKVYNRPSCLLTWLERHIVSHLGDKPYCCIVAGCGARFASQAMLERHVNGHFSGTCSTSLAVSRSLRKADSISKLARKRKPRSSRPYPGRQFLFSVDLIICKEVSNP